MGRPPPPFPPTVPKGDDHRTIAEQPSQQLLAQCDASSNRTSVSRYKQCSDFSPEDIIHAVIASRNLRQASSLPTTTSDIIDLLYKDPVRNEEARREVATSGVKIPSRQVLERGRTQLDVTMMSMQRLEFKEAIGRGDTPIIQLNPDASPIHGIEVMCCKVETMLRKGDGVDIENRVLEDGPLLSINKGNTTLLGKGMVVTHMVWLLSGPLILTMQAFRYAVASLLRIWVQSSAFATSQI